MLNVNSWKSPCSKTDFICCKANSFTSFKKQVNLR